MDQLIEEGRWDEALLVCRMIADELNEVPRMLREVLEHATLDEEQLRAEHTGSS